MGGIVRRDLVVPRLVICPWAGRDGRRCPAPNTAGIVGTSSRLEMHLMSELFALVLASLPFLLFALLLVETFRDAPTASDGLPVDLFHRSYGA